MEATEDAHIAQALAGICRRALLELSFKDRSRDRATRALGILRSFIEVHVPLGDATRALVEPVVGEGASWDAEAVALALGRTEGYPYFLQEFGKVRWARPRHRTVRCETASSNVGFAMRRGTANSPSRYPCSTSTSAGR
jgi:hypothetical protein